VSEVVSESVASGKLYAGVKILHQNNIYEIVSVYNKEYNKMMMKASIEGGPCTLVHAQLGKFGGADNKQYVPLTFEDLKQVPLRERFIPIKGVLPNQIYDPAVGIPLPNPSPHPKPPNNKQKKAASLERKYQVGERVEAKWKGSFNFFKGIVVAVNTINTYHIVFDDEGVDLSVPAKNMKPGSQEMFQVTLGVFSPHRTVPLLLNFCYHYS
jgi:hypothetical protein